MRVFLTFDVEQDCPPFRETYRGIEEGLPIILDILKSRSVTGTFFTTGDVARKFSDVVRTIVSDGHELACHGDTHKRLDKISHLDAMTEITNATKELKKFYPIKSFRAPNLKLPKRLFEHLKKEGYKLDSTGAKHKNPFTKITHREGILCVPASTTSILLRLPSSLRNIFLKRLKDPVVLFFHPWEFIDLKSEKLRFDCRFNTGDETRIALNEIIDFYNWKGANFLKMEDILDGKGTYQREGL